MNKYKEPQPKKKPEGPTSQAQSPSPKTIINEEKSVTNTSWKKLTIRHCFHFLWPFPLLSTLHAQKEVIPLQAKMLFSPEAR